MLLTIRYEIARDSERRIEEMTEQKINFLNLDFFFFEKLVIWICEFVFFFFGLKVSLGKLAIPNVFFFGSMGQFVIFLGKGASVYILRGKL